MYRRAIRITRPETPSYETVRGDARIECRAIAEGAAHTSPILTSAAYSARVFAQGSRCQAWILRALIVFRAEKRPASWRADAWCTRAAQERGRAAAEFAEVGIVSHPFLAVTSAFIAGALLGLKFGGMGTTSMRTGPKE